MKITALETCSFGPLHDGRVDLDDGLTVVQGPNEAGKSFMMRAISQALYGDASTSSKEVRELYRKWRSGDDDEFFVRAEFEHAGEKFVLTRDFGNKKNLLEKPGGKEEKDKGKIAEFMAKVIGLPTLPAFQATAFIPQEDVEKVSDESDALREIIEERLAGSGADTDKIVRKLEKKATDIRSKSGKKGALVEQQDIDAACRAEHEECKTRVEALGENKARLLAVNDDLASCTGTAAVKTKALEGSKQYIDADEKYVQADKDYDLADANSRKCREAKEKIAASSGALVGLRKQHAEADDAVKAAGEYQAKARIVKDLEKELGAIDKGIDTISRIDKELSAKNAELAGLKEVAADDLTGAQDLPGEIRGLEQALEKQVFGVAVDAGDGTRYSITTDGKAVEGAAATAHGEATVEFPGLATVRFKNETGAGEPIVDEINRKKSVLADILAKYAVKDVKGLESLNGQRLAISGEIRTLEGRKSDAVADGDLGELEARKRETAVSLDKEKVARDSLSTGAVSDEELGAWKAEVARLSSEIKSHESTVSKSEGVLNTVGDNEDALDKLRKDAAKAMAVADEARKKYEIYKCTGDEYEAKVSERHKLEEKITVLTADRSRLQAEIKLETLGEEDVSRLEERLDMAGIRIARFEEEEAILKYIVDNIKGARQDSISRFSKDIEKKMGELLSEMTDGRYDKVRVDGDLGIQIFSTEKDEWIEPSDRKDVLLSTGALDQVFLAARLAMLDLITGDCRPPVIIDDTFVAFDDMGRKRRAFELLGSLAADYQVLYFTCHDVPGEMNVLSLS